MDSKSEPKCVRGRQKMRSRNSGGALPPAAAAAEAADQVSSSAARTPLPHAPGVRTTVVTLTPSNDLGPCDVGEGHQQALEHHIGGRCIHS